MRVLGDGMFRVDNGGFPKSPEAQREPGLLPRHDPSSTVYPFTLAFFFFGLFVFMKLPRSRVGARIDQGVLFLH